MGQSGSTQQKRENLSRRRSMPVFVRGADDRNDNDGGASSSSPMPMSPATPLGDSSTAQALANKNTQREGKEREGSKARSSKWRNSVLGFVKPSPKVSPHKSESTPHTAGLPPPSSSPSSHAATTSAVIVDSEDARTNRTRSMSMGTHTTRAVKKSWRASRRWSKSLVGSHAHASTSADTPPTSPISPITAVLRPQEDELEGESTPAAATAMAPEGSLPHSSTPYPSSSQTTSTPTPPLSLDPASTVSSHEDNIATPSEPVTFPPPTTLTTDRKPLDDGHPITDPNVRTPAEAHDSQANTVHAQAPDPSIGVDALAPGPNAAEDGVNRHVGNGSKEDVVSSQVTSTPVTGPSSSVDQGPTASTSGAGPSTSSSVPQPQANPVSNVASNSSTSTTTNATTNASTTTGPGTAHTATTSSAPTGTGSRGFPPPGTLVLVQGVVQTTDVTRTPPTSSTARPEQSSPSATGASAATSSRRRAASVGPPSSGGARSRLSGLLNPQSTNATATAERGSIPAREPSSPGSEPLDSMPAFGPSSPSPSGGSVPPALGDPASSSTISSSSIEVLGTLLSVAAAATAASLLTGSAASNLSSTSSPASSSNTSSQSSSPSSNTDPSSLSSPTDSPLPQNEFGHTARRERMRQAWGSLRERLGLRAQSNTPSTTSSGSATPRSGAGSAPGGVGGAGAMGVGMGGAGMGGGGGGGGMGGMGSGLGHDAREMMLTEMARAFNLGLGLDGSSDSSSNPSSPSASTARVPHGEGADQGAAGSERAQEGSFDRFLEDLQADLREVLTSDARYSSDEDVSDDDDEEDEEEDEDYEDADDEDQDAEHDDLNQRQGEEERQPEDDAEQSVPLLSDLPSPSPQPSSPLPTVPSPSRRSIGSAQRRRVSVDSLPSLASVSDSSVDEDDDEEHEEDEAHPSTSPQLTQPHNASATRVPWDSTATHTHARRVGGGEGAGQRRSPRSVNWWRTYRFSPIPARSVAGGVDAGTLASGLSTAAAASSSPAAGAAPSSSSTSGVGTGASSSPGVPPLSPLIPSAPTGSMPSETSSSTTSPSTTAAPVLSNPTAVGDNSDVVYPVIVVGLRSVNTPHDREAARGTGSGTTRPRRTDTPRPMATSLPSVPGSVSPHNNHDDNEDEEYDGLDGLGDLSGVLGDEGVSRVPSPGGTRTRTAGARGGDEAALPGSRTFLIFVIGGYYPPGHSMVVGGANNLGSFEALLELTELLGQVKPSTATRDDIEKSGLEILKASELKAYEAAGKITPNCTDRCLICLDDYVDEDDVRLLSCRHAFHKPCVDRWLETGKNSCPACRSKGVNTDGAAGPSSAFA